MDKKLALSAPWVTFAREISALFDDDPAIHVEYDEDNVEVKLYVEGVEKADAISQLLPVEKAFGGVTLKITVIPANEKVTTPKYTELFRKAFKDNPVFENAVSVEGIFSNPITYVIFRKRVVQYYNDDLGDINGICSTLYQNIAKNIFADSVQGVNYCTDTVDPVIEETKTVKSLKL